jgi:hypothetical protein
MVPIEPEYDCSFDEVPAASSPMNLPRVSNGIVGCLNLHMGSLQRTFDLYDCPSNQSYLTLFSSDTSFVVPHNFNQRLVSLL